MRGSITQLVVFYSSVVIIYVVVMSNFSNSDFEFITNAVIEGECFAVRLRI